MRKEHRELKKTLGKQWNMSIAKGGHLHLTHKSGFTFFTSATPSDHRSRKNFLALVKRKLRERHNG